MRIADNVRTNLWRHPGVKRTCFAITAALALLAGAGGLHAAESDEIRGPDVTIIEEEDRTVQEYRQNGYLRMIRIVPKMGKPYYLVPRDNTAGYEDLEQADTLLPNWVIVEF